MRKKDNDIVDNGIIYNGIKDNEIIDTDIIINVTMNNDIIKVNGMMDMIIE